MKVVMAIAFIHSVLAMGNTGAASAGGGAGEKSFVNTINFIHPKKPEPTKSKPIIVSPLIIKQKPNKTASFRLKRKLMGDGLGAATGGASPMGGASMGGVGGNEMNQITAPRFSAPLYYPPRPYAHSTAQTFDISHMFNALLR